jgi:hypothetical protein
MSLFGSAQPRTLAQAAPVSGQVMMLPEKMLNYTEKILTIFNRKVYDHGVDFASHLTPVALVTGASRGRGFL